MPSESTQPDEGLLEDVLRAAFFAADFEAMEPRPVSSVRNPDGSPQQETNAEFTRRVVRTAVLHLLEQGLLVVADDAAGRLENGILMKRATRSHLPEMPQ